MKRLAALMLVSFGLAGCLGSAPPVPRDHYYRVLVPPPVALGQTARFPGVLTVKVLEADGLLRERPLVYSSSGQPHEMQQHDYYYWIDPPPRMLQGQLVDYLRGSGLAHSVVTPDLRIKPDLEVTGRIKRLERLLGGGPPRVIAELELGLVYTAEDRLIVIESYSAEIAADDDGVEASVQALNRALAQVFGKFLADASRQDLAGLAAHRD